MWPLLGLDHRFVRCDLRPLRLRPLRFGGSLGFRCALRFESLRLGCGTLRFESLRLGCSTLRFESLRLP